MTSDNDSASQKADTIHKCSIKRLIKKTLLWLKQSKRDDLLVNSILVESKNVEILDGLVFQNFDE